MSDYCLYPNQCGAGMDCSACYQAHIADLKTRLAAAEAQATSAVPDVVNFGNGEWMVQVGMHGGLPAVFVEPANPAGTPGELAPPTPGDERHRLVEGEWVMTFPTEEQAHFVAYAIVGRTLAPQPADSGEGEG